MIVNYEQDNTSEGNYITVSKFQKTDSSVSIKIPENFFITAVNFKNWVIGWGNNIPLHDAGVENIRGIEAIDFKNGKIYLSKFFRGRGFPAQNQRIVFWNTRPSGFSNELKNRLLTRKYGRNLVEKALIFLP